MKSTVLKRLPLLALVVLLSCFTLAAAGCGCGGCTSCALDSCDLEEVLDQVSSFEDWLPGESLPVEPGTPGEPDLTYLEDALYYFIISTYDVTDLYLFHEEAVHGMEELEDRYGDDIVVVYRYTDQGRAVVVELGEPFSEYFLQVTMVWDDGDWVVEDVTEIDY